ncbi:Sodium/potassium-transporting ATPase subunit alpha-1 like [Fagus crenata]
MFRALSTRRSHRRYEQLGDDPAAGLLEAKLKRVTSLPAKMFGSSSKLTPEVTFPNNSQVKPTKKVSKSHPIFSLFNARRKKKTTARPEFARYLEYVKEGGLWDMNLNKPVIYYK